MELFWLCLAWGFSLRICEQLTRRFRKSEEVNVDPASIEQISKSEEHTKKKVDTNRLALLCVALKWHRLGILTLWQVLIKRTELNFHIPMAAARVKKKITNYLLLWQSLLYYLAYEKLIINAWNFYKIKTLLYYIPPPS